jgi:ankyrin repeat protein
VIQKYFARLAACVVLATLVTGCALFVPSHNSTEEYTPFFAAASAGNLAEVQQDVSANPDLVKAIEWDNATALHDAVGQNHKDMAAYLLDKGAKVDAVTKDGLTPLHLAAQNGNIPIIELLIQRGAPLNALDAKGWTPLDRASKWDHPDAVNVLRKDGGHEGR